MPVIYQRYANAITFCRIKIAAHEEPLAHNLKDQILSCFISLYYHCIWFNNVGFAHMVIKIPVIPTWRQSANVCSRNGSIAGWELIDLSDVVLEQYSTSYKVTSEAILFTVQAVVFCGWLRVDIRPTSVLSARRRPNVGPTWSATLHALNATGDAFYSSGDPQHQNKMYISLSPYQISAVIWK